MQAFDILWWCAKYQKKKKVLSEDNFINITREKMDTTFVCGKVKYKKMWEFYSGNCNCEKYVKSTFFQLKKGQWEFCNHKQSFQILSDAGLPINNQKRCHFYKGHTRSLFWKVSQMFGSHCIFSPPFPSGLARCEDQQKVPFTHHLQVCGITLLLQKTPLHFNKVFQDLIDFGCQLA